MATTSWMGRPDIKFTLIAIIIHPLSIGILCQTL